MRVTFIAADGSREECRGRGVVKHVNEAVGHHKVYLPVADAPDWVTDGDHLVAAEDGTVECAFEIRNYGTIDDQSKTRTSLPWGGPTEVYLSFQY